MKNGGVLLLAGVHVRLCSFLHMQAIKNRASLRVWILFTLLVLSFALLFLDWYS